MNKEELIKIFSAYLPFGLDIQLPADDSFPNKITKLSGIMNYGLLYLGSGGRFGFTQRDIDKVKPVLYDLSYLTKEIEHQGKNINPVEYFEITDDSDSYPIEHDHGNIKLIKDLESIAKNNSYHDIQFLPFEIVQRLISFHINVFGLKEDQFINKATLLPCEKKK